MKTSTKLYLCFAFILSGNIIFAQTAKVVDTPDGTVISTIGGNEIPHSTAILDIRSTNKGILLPRMTTANRDVISVPTAGLLIYNTSTNQFNYHNGSSWQVASLGNQWGVNGSVLHHSGQVGVGTSTMTNANTFLTVRGNLGGTNLEGMYIDASSTTGKAFYGYSVNDSSRAYHYYDGSTSKWNLAMGGLDRITVTSSGFVGIGTTSPTYRLSVGGSTYISGGAYIASTSFIGDYLEVDGSIYGYNNLSVSGVATIKGGKGVAYNASSSQNLRIFRFTTDYIHVALAAHASTSTTVTFAGGFTSTPYVMVGDIDLSGGTAGELHRVILVLSGCSLNTTNGDTTCNAKLINTDNSSLDYSIRWNCVAIGY
ncbi:hypothetical protein [Emticicia sp. BO119]|uniref:hypothetical protein n=1 Tax=Emticicia sp. BO119 TaxID=2757768 RepID=UPI0015F0B2D1|nr:hypothetical protein [Emticicia sp. BO119]MBA4852130.1 hypothetical protein [Emticicia sp. BO119]